MPDGHDIERDLQSLAAEMRRLEAEYNMFFAGRLPRPPWETRNRVESIIKYWSGAIIGTSAERFRFSTLQSRSAESGEVVHEAAFSNPRSEMDKVENLYQSLMSARREAGQEVVPFHKFANFVRDQVKQFQEGGDSEVAFRVAVKDGQVSFTVRSNKE